MRQVPLVVEDGSGNEVDDHARSEIHGCDLPDRRHAKEHREQIDHKQNGKRSEQKIYAHQPLHGIEPENNPAQHSDKAQYRGKEGIERAFVIDRHDIDAVKVEKIPVERHAHPDSTQHSGDNRQHSICETEMI